MPIQKGYWENTDVVKRISYICGFCDSRVGPTEGYYATTGSGVGRAIYGNIYICPNCNKPTYEDQWHRRYPRSTAGKTVEHLPENILNLYNEARNCISVNAYTSAVLSFRKLLMNVAVIKGADENLRFAQYVDYLDNNHYVPPGSKEWVDHIRKKGNEATHEIPDMKEEDAVELLEFTEVLLRIVFEMPGRMNKYNEDTNSD